MAPAAKQPESLDKGLKDLNLTNEELNKFEKAFKDPEFIKLFEEYAKEVSDPKVKAETDQYLRQLEEQGRAEEVYGKGVQLLTPKPGLVLKSKVLAAKDVSEADAGDAGSRRDSLPVGQKVFINVCTSDKVERYSLQEGKDANGRVGKQLSIPITTGPVRQGVDKQGLPAAVYDVVVHPDTIEFAATSTPVMSNLAEMALEQVEKVSCSRLSRGWRRLSARYKTTEGCPEPPVVCVRTGEGGESVGGRLRPRADAPAVDVPGAKSAAAAAVATTAAAGPAVAAAGGNSGSAKAAASRSGFSFGGRKDGAGGQRSGGARQEEVKDPAQPGYRHPDGTVTPEWTLVHRGQTDLAAAWGDAGRGLMLDMSVPKEMVVRVTLPDVTSAGAVDLDVGERRLTLKVPGKHLLDIPLPYTVDVTKGKAKFDKARKQLEITLPVVPPPPPAPAAVAAAAAAAAAVRELPAEGPMDDVMPAACREGEVAAEEGSAVAATRTAAPETAAAAASGSAEGREAVAAPCVESSSDDAWRPQGSAEQEAAEGDGAELRSPMTENERRWRELHGYQEPAAGEVAGGGGDSAAAAEVTAGTTGVSSSSLPMRPEHPSELAAASDTALGAACATAEFAAAPAVEPTVLLKPRLRRDLAMELD